MHTVTPNTIRLDACIYDRSPDSENLIEDDSTKFEGDSDTMYKKGLFFIY